MPEFTITNRLGSLVHTVEADDAYDALVEYGHHICMSVRAVVSLGYAAERVE